MFSIMPAKNKGRQYQFQFNTQRLSNSLIKLKSIFCMHFSSVQQCLILIDSMMK